MNFLTNKKDIKKWLDTYSITQYGIEANSKYGFVVDVAGSVNLSNKNLAYIHVKFNIVKGFLDFSNNKIKSLEFCPTIVGGDFYCDNNALTSLKGCPQDIGGSFYCNNNKLTSLEFGPRTVEEFYNCNNNSLKSLEFCPKDVGNMFACDNNPLLGSLQKVYDFDDIYKEHLRIKNIKQLNNKLSTELSEKESLKITKI